MNGLLWAALALAISGIAALVAGTFWRTKKSSADDFAIVMTALVVFIVCETMAVVLAIVGCIVEIF